MREPGGWNQADVGAALTALRNIDLSLEGIHTPINAILDAVVDPKSMPQPVGNLTSDRNILTDVRPGARLRLFLVGGGELRGVHRRARPQLRPIGPARGQGHRPRRARRRRGGDQPVTAPRRMPRNLDCRPIWQRWIAWEWWRRGPRKPTVLDVIVTALVLAIVFFWWGR